MVNVYEPLYNALHNYNFLVIFVLPYVVLTFSFLYFGGIFNNNIIPFLLVGYQMIIVTRLSTSWLSICTCTISYLTHPRELIIVN